MRPPKKKNSLYDHNGPTNSGLCIYEYNPFIAFSGMMKAGVNAIMGPSGSGKTRWGGVCSVYVYGISMVCFIMYVKIDVIPH